MEPESCAEFERASWAQRSLARVGGSFTQLEVGSPRRAHNARKGVFMRYRSLAIVVTAVAMSLSCSEVLGQYLGDECHNAVVFTELPGALGRFPASTTGGLQDCSVPNDKWIHFAPAIDSTLLLEVSNCVLSVYEVAGGLPGDCPLQGDRILCSLDTTTSLPVVGGFAYYFQVGSDSSSSWFVEVDWFSDDCDSPEVIPALPFVERVPGVLSTTDNPPGCPVSLDRWYYYSSPYDGRIGVDSFSNPPGNISVYGIPGGVPGDCPTASDRILCAVSEETFPVSAGTGYYFQVETAPDVEQPLSVYWYPDLCSEALVIPSLPFRGGRAFGLSVDDSFPDCVLLDNLWYRFEAPHDGVIATEFNDSASIHFSAYEVIGAAPGSCPTPSDRLLCDSTYETIPVISGATYFFEVGLNMPVANPASLTFDWLPDSCSQPVTLPIPSRAELNLRLASASPVDTPCVFDHDEWYRCVAPADGWVRLLVGAGLECALYEDPGTCPGPADLLHCGGSTHFLADAGASYLVQVGASSPAPAEVGVTLEYALPPGVVDDRITFAIAPQYVTPGVDFTFPVLLRNEPTALGPVMPIDGWSYGVCHDAAELQGVSVELGPIWFDPIGAPPGFFSNNIYADQGFSGGAVVDLFGNRKLREGEHEINTVTYRAIGAPPYSASLTFCDTIGTPPVATVVVVQGSSELVQIENGVVNVVRGTPFRRGDCSPSGEIDIADAIRLLEYLFDSGPALACELACDANDDSATDIADALAVLGYLFGVPSSALPLPECGIDPTPGTLSCDVGAVCP